MVQSAYRAADIARADRAIANLGTLSDELGLPYVRWQHTIVTAARLLTAGHTDEAEAVNNSGLEIGTAAGIPEALGTFGGILHAIRWQQGRIDEILDFFIDAARDNPSIAVLRAAVVSAMREVGRIDEARHLLAQEAASGFDFPYDGAQWLPAMTYMADTAATVEDHAAARTLIDRIAPYDTEVVCPLFVEGACARSLARLATLLGEYNQAEEWFAITHDIHTRLQTPFWTALGYLDHADLCLASRADGDLDRARQLATSAAATAAEYNYAGLTKRAAAILAVI
jgi:hypothetical protein